MKALRVGYKLAAKESDHGDFSVLAVDIRDALEQHPNMKDIGRAYCGYDISDTIISGMTMWDALDRPIGLNWEDSDDYCMDYEY